MIGLDGISVFYENHCICWWLVIFLWYLFGNSYSKNECNIEAGFQFLEQPQKNTG